MNQLTMNTLRAAAFAAATTLVSFGAGAQNIKIGYIDPLSGGGATIGEHGLKHLQFLVETINAKGGVLGGQKLEVVAYDNKASPQESLVQVQKAIDAGANPHDLMTAALKCGLTEREATATITSAARHTRQAA